MFPVAESTGSIRSCRTEYDKTFVELKYGDEMMDGAGSDDEIQKRFTSIPPPQICVSDP